MNSEKEKLDVDIEEKLLYNGEKTLNGDGKKESKSNEFFVLFCVVTVNTFIILTGCTISWTSPVLIKLYSNDTSINPLGQPITKLQESIIAGLPSLGCLLTPFILSTFIEKLGKKKVLAIFGGVQILSFVLLTVGSKIEIYYLSRLLGGIGLGITSPVITLYIMEISPAHSRGRYGSMIGMFVPIGNLLSYVIGPLLSIQLFSIVCALPSLITFPFFLWLVPDSPTSLVSRGKIQKATEVLRKLRGTKKVEEELEEIFSICNKHEAEKKVNIKRLLNDRASLAGLRIGFGISFISIFSGVMVLMAFVGPIFQTVNTAISGNTVAIFVGLVKLISFSFTTAVIERFKRKTLLMFSTISISICLFLLGVYFYLQESIHMENLEQYSALPIVCILLFFVFYSTGLGPIAHIFNGELFPGRYKAIAISVLSIGYTLGAFLVTFSFRFVVFYCGTYTVFWIFSSVCFLGTFFIHFKVPETRGKTLLEIHQMLDELHI